MNMHLFFILCMSKSLTVIKLKTDRTMQHKTLPTSLLMVVGAFLGYALTLSEKLPLPSVKESCYEANKSSCVLSCVNG